MSEQYHLCHTTVLALARRREGIPLSWSEEGDVEGKAPMSWPWEGRVYPVLVCPGQREAYSCPGMSWSVGGDGRKGEGGLPLSWSVLAREGTSVLDRGGEGTPVLVCTGQLEEMGGEGKEGYSCSDLSVPGDMEGEERVPVSWVEEGRQRSGTLHPPPPPCEQTHIYENITSSCTYVGKIHQCNGSTSLEIEISGFDHFEALVDLK